MPVDVKALRELAEKATTGPWHHDWTVNDKGLVGSNLEGDNTAPAKNGGFYVAQTLGPDHVANAAFIAAANPSTVLALLDEIERKDRAGREIVGAVDHLVTMFGGGMMP